MDYEQYQRKNPVTAEVVKQGQVIGRGDRKKVVPPDEVYKLARLGCTLEEISDWFDVSRETLKYNFNKLILRARSDIKQDLRRAQIRVALEGNPTMLIWLGKALLGQTDQPQSAALEPLPFLDEEAPGQEPEDLVEDIDTGTEETPNNDAVPGTSQHPV
jgi:hypothetical protein